MNQQLEPQPLVTTVMHAQLANAPHKRNVLTFDEYAQHFNTGDRPSINAERIYHTMSPPVTVGVEFIGLSNAMGYDPEGHLIDPRPWGALFHYADEYGYRVHRIDLKRRVIVLDRLS